MSKENRRIIFIYVLVVMLFMVMIGRLGYLQIIKYSHFKKLSERQQTRKITLFPLRADIVDRKGEILATSQKAWSAYMNANDVKDKDLLRKELKEVFKLEEAQIAKILSQKASFVWVKQKVTNEMKKKITSKGIYFLPDMRRVYPLETTACKILGHVGLYDNLGKNGLELVFDNKLIGKTGFMIIESDLRGRDIFSYNKRVDPAEEGKKVELTIDKDFQFIMDNELNRGVEATKARSGAGVLMDIKTGEILALSSAPLYDPNNYFAYSDDLSIFRIDSIFYAYEPGSISKLFTIAAALEEGEIQPNEKIDSPFQFNVSGTIIKEAHPDDENPSSIKDLSEVLIKSLNVGAAKIGLRLGPKKLHEYLKKLGFGQFINLGLPGESRGYLSNYKDWYPVDTSRISFGYGYTATPLQLARAVACLANEGNLVEPYILKEHEAKPPLKIFSKKTTDKMMEMMKDTVEKGTGGATRIEGHLIGGKTGTSIIHAQKGGYQQGRYNTSFVGVFPVDNPKYVMIITVIDPRTSGYAASTAVPVFKKIAEKIIRYENMPPDQKIESGNKI